MSDEAPSKREQRQAEALARALEGQAEAGPAPPEALEAAGLLVQSRDEPLAAERKQAIYARVEAALAAPQSAAAGRRRRSWWLPGTLAATAAAAAALALMLWLPLEPSPTGLPRPDSALLHQQARAAAGQAAAARGLARHMRAYRRVVLAELEQRYRPAAAPAPAAVRSGRSAPAARSVLAPAPGRPQRPNLPAGGRFATTPAGNPSRAAAAGGGRATPAGRCSVSFSVQWPPAGRVAWAGGQGGDHDG